MRLFRMDSVWSRKAGLGALTLALIVASAGLVASATERPITRTGGKTLGESQEQARIPIPVRPGCCMPPAPTTFEAVCQIQTTSQECMAAGGRPVRSCVQCQYMFVPQDQEEQFSSSGNE